MKTLAFATDIHRDARFFDWLSMAVRDYDIVAIGGDLDFPGLKKVHQLVEYAARPNLVRDRLLRVSQSLPSKLVVVLGDHDRPSPGALHGRVVTAGGLSIGGVGGALPGRSPANRLVRLGRYLLAARLNPMTPFQLREWQYRSLLDQLGHVDILIAHMPVADTKCDIGLGGDHFGSRAIREYVRRERPKLVLTGHTHESAVDSVGESFILNPGGFVEGKYGKVEIHQDSVKATIRDLEE